MDHWQASSRRRPSDSFAPNSSHIPFTGQVVDACLAIIVLVAPLAFGGRHDLGRLIFISLSCVTAAVWFVGQTLSKRASWNTTPAHGLAFAMLALVALQVMPMPLEQLEHLAPRIAGLLPIWFYEPTQALRLGEWQTLSLTPSATKLALATLLAYVLLFVVIVQRVKTVRDVERLVKLVACSAVMMATFGLIQYFTSNGCFFWFYEVPFTDTKFPVKGSFTCRNHFADFLTLGLSPLIVWSLLNSESDKQRSRRHHEKKSLIIKNLLLHGCVALLVFAVFMTLSRGGMIALTVATLFTLFMLFAKGLVSSSYFYGLAVLGLVVVGLLSLNNYEKLACRVSNFTAGSLDELDGHDARRRIWAANVAAIREGGLFGSGAGSHREIYPTYLVEPFSKVYTHAETVICK